MFELSEEQRKTLEKFKPQLGQDKEYIDWYNEQMDSSLKIRQKLKDTGFDRGQDLSLPQLYELGDLVNARLGNTALGMRGKSSMFEANELKTFNEKLRSLLFSQGSLTQRVDSFLNLKFVGTQTVSQFLCKFDPEKYPFFAGYMNRVFGFLSIDQNQRNEARARAIDEFAINTKIHHHRTSEYFESCVILREIRNKIGLADYLSTQNLLWIIYRQCEPESEKRHEASDVEEEETEPEKPNLTDFVESVDLERLSKISTHRLKNPDKATIDDIISYCADTCWVLPHFQRYFDWSKEDIRSFLESIFNNYYAGSFLLWHAGGEPQVGVQPIKGISKTSDLKSDLIILDGQQRITSLFYGISAPNSEDFEEKSHWKDTRVYKEHPVYFYIDFNRYLKDPKSQGLIRTYHKKLDAEECFRTILFPLYELKAYDVWLSRFEKFLRNYSKDNDKVYYIKEALRKKLAHMWAEYEIPYIYLPKTMEIDEVTDIFEQLNTKGKRLSVFDLLIAKLYKHGIPLRQLWDATTEKYPNISRYSKAIPKTPVYLLQAISLFYDENSSARRSEILKIYENTYENNKKGYRFEDHWAEFSEYMNTAIGALENLRDGFGVKDEKELPFAPMIPVITAVLRLIDTQEKKADCNKKLDKWYWSSVFTNAYSSAADTQMTSDFKELKEWFKDDSKIPKTLVNMMDGLPRLNLFEIKKEWNSKYRGVMSLLALEGAKDFDTGKTLEFARSDDKDHLFPHSKNYGFGSAKNVNSVLNMTWMSETTNRRIKSCQKPSEYVHYFIDEKYDGDEGKFKEVLRTHLINERAYNCLLKDDVDSFLEERRKAILAKLASRLDISDLKIETFMISPETPYSNKKAFWNVIRSCKGYIHWIDKYFSKVGLEILSDSMDSKNSKEIKILMAYEKDRNYESFRKLFKDFKEECTTKGINCELRMITDPKIKSEFHDRWILSEDECYNVPSTDVVARGQTSEIKKTPNKPPFEKWWKESKDIISDWNDITSGKSPS